MRTPGTAADLERRRRLAVHRLQEGMAPRVVAQFLEIHIRTVRKWWMAYQRHGEAGLDSKPQSGRPPKLKPRQVTRVLSWFRQTPRSFGFATDLWTARRVAQVIERKWNVQFNPRYLNRWLTARGITSQKPQRVAREADHSAIERWRHDWPRLQNRRAASGPPLCSSMKAACC